MLKCLQFALPCPFLAENCLDIHMNTMRGSMKSCFAKEMHYCSKNYATEDS